MADETEKTELEAVEDEVQEHVSEDIDEKIEKTVETGKQEQVDRSFMQKLKDRFMGNETSDEEDGDPIPDEFVEAGKKANWTDEQIVDFASNYTDEELKEMIPSLLGEDTAQADEPSAKVDVKPEQVKETVEDSQEGDKANQALIERLAAVEKRLQLDEQTRKEQEFNGFIKEASDLFDAASEEFEVFGKTEELPTFPDGRYIPTSPQMKARSEVFGMAQLLKEAGVSSKEALEFSLNAFKGKNLATEVKRKTIKDLKKQEKTLGGKRSSQTTEGRKVSGPDVLDAVARKHGVVLPP